MSNKSRLQTNNTNLQELINKAENLPDAGSGSGEDLDSVITELETKVASLNTTLDGKAAGGGSGGIDSNETCDISISTDYNFNYFIGWMDSGAGIGYIFEDGARNYGFTFTVKAKCGTVLHVGQAGFYAATATGGEIIGTQHGCGFAFKVPDTPMQCTIDIITD